MKSKSYLYLSIIHSTAYYPRFPLAMSSTKEQQLALRRIQDAKYREQKRAIVKEHPILLERIATLERHLLLLKIENEKLKNANKSKGKTEQCLLEQELDDIDYEVQNEILNIPINKSKTKKTKKPVKYTGPTPIVLEDDEEDDDFTI